MDTKAAATPVSVAAATTGTTTGALRLVAGFLGLAWETPNGIATAISAGAAAATTGVATGAANLTADFLGLA
jgi:hypothetical protein